MNQDKSASQLVCKLTCLSGQQEVVQGAVTIPQWFARQCICPGPNRPGSNQQDLNTNLPSLIELPSPRAATGVNPTEGLRLAAVS